MSDIDLSEITDYKTTELDGGILDGNGYKIVGISGNTAGLLSLKNSAVAENLSAELNGGCLFAKVSDSQVFNCNTSGVASTFIVQTDEYASPFSLSIGCSLAYSVDNSTITSCYNTAKITDEIVLSHVPQYVGGLVNSIVKSTIQNCYNEGAIDMKSKSGLSIGGIVAASNDTSTIINCYNSGNITATMTDDSASACVFGISGEPSIYMQRSESCSIENSFNSGDLVATVNNDAANANLVNGIGGRLITNCYNSGDLIGPNTFAFNGMIANLTAKNCYSVGNIMGTVTSAISKSKDMENCYFLDNIQNATPDGALFATVKQLTVDQMKDKSSFAGFDFDTVWEMGGPDYPYPVFQAVYELEGGD